MSQSTIFPTKLHVHPVKSQISLHIRTQFDQCFLCTVRIAKDQKAPNVKSKDSHQAAQIRRLVPVFMERTCNIAGNDPTQLTLQ